VGGKRRIAALLTFRGNALPLFWHCRLAVAPQSLDLRALITWHAACYVLLTKNLVEGFRHEHQLR
jgi:hypothetical protein